MTSLKDNNIIEQIHRLLSSAIGLKEQFDLENPIQDLREAHRLYAIELDILERISPSEIFYNSNLSRHSGWMQKYIDKNQPQNCYSDINGICHYDIFCVEKNYLEYLANSNQVAEKFYDWQNIHPVIKRIARSRFETNHFADAVEASFKEINDIVKKTYFAKKGEELDGVQLMRKAFSNNKNEGSPILSLTNNSTDSECNIQEGYMNILVGSMQGIRNPTAHANLDFHIDEAWELVIIASHLMNKLSQVIENSIIEESN